MGKVPHSNKAAGDPGSAVPKETIIPETGEYSRLMLPDEYREWVRQAIAGQIFGRMTAIFSAVGIATLFAAFTFFSNLTNSTIETKVTAINSAIAIQNNEQTRRLNDSITTMQEKTLPNLVNTELSTQIRTNELERKITESAVKKILSDTAIETEIANLTVNRSQKILENPKSANSMRVLALQQILLLGNPKQQSDAIRDVITNSRAIAEIKGSEFELALQNYPSYQDKTSTREQLLLLTNILDRAALHGAELSDESWSAIQRIVGTEKDVLDACRWIKDATVFQSRTYNAQSLRKIVERLARTEGLSAAEQFVDWLESENKDLVRLGLQGLAAIPLRQPDGQGDPAKRQAIAGRAAQTLVRADVAALMSDDVNAYLSQVVTAIRLRDKIALRRLGDSEFGTVRIKRLLTDLVRDPEGRGAWTFADRRFSTTRELREYAQYGPSQRNRSVYRLMGSLLETEGKSADWQQLIAARIAEAGESWTKPGAAHLLVNSWVHRLQNSPLPSQASVDVAAELFVSAHLRSDPDLLSDDFDSYRYLIGRASDDIVRRLLDNAPNAIGAADRSPDAKEDVDGNESAILSDALTRSLRTIVAPARLRQMRAGLLEGSLKGHAIWFAAVARTAGISGVSVKQPEYLRIFSGIVERAKRGDLTPSTATHFLYLLANKSYLVSPAVQVAAARANLHMLADDHKEWAADPQVGELFQSIAADVKATLGLVDAWETRAIPLATSPVTLPVERTWLSFELQPNRIAQVVISPPKETKYLIVEPLGRVFDFGTLAAPKDSTTPLLINVPAGAGPRFLQLTITSQKEATTALLKYDVIYRADELPSSRTGAIVDIKIGQPIHIQSNGNDEAWLRLAAKAGKVYNLRTHTLRATAAGDSVDTEIEAYDASEGPNPLDSDDDGGREGGETLASLLSLTPDRDMTYHIRIKNLDARGTFVFEINEKID